MILRLDVCRWLLSCSFQFVQLIILIKWSENYLHNVLWHIFVISLAHLSVCAHFCTRMSEKIPTPACHGVWMILFVLLSDLDLVKLQCLKMACRLYVLFLLPSGIFIFLFSQRDTFVLSFSVIGRKMQYQKKGHTWFSLTVCKSSIWEWRTKYHTVHQKWSLSESIF